VGHYPKIKPYVERLVNDLLGYDNDEDRVSSVLLRQQLGDEAFEQFQLIRDITRLKGAQARLPVTVKF